MNQEIIFKRKNPFAGQLLRLSSLFIPIFFIHPFLFSQAKQDTINKAGQSSSNSIVIHQESNFKVAPRQLYEVLLSSKSFSACTKKSFPAFSDKSATIDPVTGGVFSLFDGHITGRIVELVPNQLIVEAWRVVDWPAGVYSIARFELTASGSGTHLVFDHIGFPRGLKEHLADGWQQHYWDALAKYFQ